MAQPACRMVHLEKLADLVVGDCGVIKKIMSGLRLADFTGVLVGNGGYRIITI